MDSRIRSNKQEDLVPDHISRLAGLFTARIYLVFLSFIAAVVALSAWQIQRSYLNIRTTETQIEQLIGLEKAALHRDEVLAMSARVAALVGKPEWADRHDELGSRVEAVVGDILQIFRNDTVDAVNAQKALPGFVDDKLDTIESQALSLVRQGENEEAVSLLQSPEYEKQRQEHGRGISAFVANARGVLEDRRAMHLARIRAVVMGAGISLSVIAFIWLLVYIRRKRLYERELTERRLNVFAKEWQKTFNAISDAVCIVDKNGAKVLQCNLAMTRFVRRRYEQIVGRSCCELLHGSPEPAKRCPLLRMCKTGRSETTDFQVDDKWLRIKVDPLKNDEGQVVGAVHITSDITKQKNASRALQESENKFRLAFANAQDAIVWVDAESGVVTNCNKATEELFGRKAKEIIGHHHTSLSPAGKAEHFHSLLDGSGRALDSNVETEISAREGQAKTVTISFSAMRVDSKEIVQAIIRDITESKRANEQINSLAKFPSEDPNPVLRISEDGRILYANDASSPVLATWQAREGEPVPELWCQRVEKIAGSSRSETYELECDDGRTFFMTLQPIVGSGYVNAYGLDITKRKKAEQQKIELELQLSQQQKMEAIGTLAGGIAHDFNNILAAMQGYLELSLDDLSDENAVRDHLEKMSSCVDRATKLVRQILTFSRKNQQQQEKEPVQISSIVREVHGMLRSSLPATIKFNQRIEADSSFVMADPTQIHQVLVNLCTNASHAMRDAGGLLEVVLKDVDLDAETRIGDELLRPGRYVEISVSDSGCGMDKDVLERIFEPFFTTRKVNEGTGLGLSVVHGIIKNHGGAIAVRSTPGKGTTFDIFLPRIERDETQESQSSEPAASDNEVILLVDDEEVVVDVTKQILDRLGFDVVAKTSSVEALETFQADPDKFDLVITDQVMPDMTGTQLAEKLISIRPDISIILCSGYPENVSPGQLESIGIKEFVLKPVARQEIAKIIRRVLYKSAAKA